MKNVFKIIRGATKACILLASVIEVYEFTKDYAAPAIKRKMTGVLKKLGTGQATDTFRD